MTPEQLFLKHFSDAIDFDPQQSLALEAKLESLPTWDSLGFVSTMAMFDSEYDTALDVDDVRRCIYVKDIYSLIKKK